MKAIEKIVAAFDLTPHPEGGFYKETYRASLSLTSLPDIFNGSRAASTAIYYLLPGGAKSAFHRIKSDELWHFYEGGPLKIVEIDPNSGDVFESILGPPSTGGRYQHLVPANRWFGAMPMPESTYSFVGCTVAPGFDFQDFELAAADDFFATYPSAEKYRALLP